MKTLTMGIAGSAKNTGKTTTTRALLEHFQGSGVTLGLTSIGYDGESVDNVTGLPKPRVYLEAGALVAVAEGCLPAGTARVKVIDRTDIATPLGKIVCGRVVQEGLLVLAGPNQSRHLRVIRDWMILQGAGLVMVDGALNRIAPMVETDGFILCTGAAYTTDLERLALETRSLEALCSLQEVREIPAGAVNKGKSVIWDQGGRVMAELPPSLLDPDSIKMLSGFMVEAAGFYCPGVIASRCLELLGEMPFSPGISFVFEDPVKLLLSGSTITALGLVEKVTAGGGRAGYRRPLPLVAVTVNPFYPCYRYETSDYCPAYVDGEQLLSKIKACLDVPVFDIVREGPEELGRTIKAFASGGGHKDNGVGK
ncbi:MAG: hypothetical protein ACOY30_04480 [Bacillota bacterium]